jgi:phytoene dehydrogenase-like protein
MGDETFGGEAARRLLAGAALHADLAPEAALSGFFGWLMCALGQDVGFPVAEGGSQSLTTALVRRFEARGGRVVCDTAVRSILVRGKRAEAVRTSDGVEIRARRAVLADVSAPVLYRSLLSPDDLPARLLTKLERFQWDNATVKVDWNLDEPIPWSASAARRAGTVHVAASVDALTKASAELACGEAPRDPFLVMGQQSMTDPSRQPPGKETAWAYTHVPHRRRGGGPPAPFSADEVADRMQAIVEQHAPGFGELVRDRHVLSPGGFEAENPSLVGGALNAGTAQLHQQLVFRPVPGLGRPETPVRGLFLASASAHPGGGVHGAPGANAARAALAHARLRVSRAR